MGMRTVKKVVFPRQCPFVGKPGEAGCPRDVQSDMPQLTVRTDVPLLNLTALLPRGKSCPPPTHPDPTQPTTNHRED